MTAECWMIITKEMGRKQKVNFLMWLEIFFFFFNEISKALGFRGLDSILRTSSPQLSLTIVPGYLMFYSGLCRHRAHTQHIKTYMQAKRPYPFFKLKKKIIETLAVD